MTSPYEVTRNFEQAVAEFTGAKYGVATDSCTSAILLSLLYEDVKNTVVQVPRRTYPSVPMAIVHAGGRIRWVDLEWQGRYTLYPTVVVDAAKSFHRGMYKDLIYPRSPLVCLSFHLKKLLPIGRGGMILTDSEEAAKYLRMMRFDGREECPLHLQRDWPLIGYNCYMTPEQSARGLQLLSLYKDQPDQVEDPPYPACSIMECFKPYTAERLKSES